VAAVEKQAYFVLRPALARHGYRGGVRHSGDRLEISAGGLSAPRNGSHLLWHRSDWRNHPGGRVTQTAPGRLDRGPCRLAKSVHAVRWVAPDLRADVPIGQ